MAVFFACAVVFIGTADHGARRWQLILSAGAEHVQGTPTIQRFFVGGAVVVVGNLGFFALECRRIALANRACALARQRISACGIGDQRGALGIGLAHVRVKSRGVAAVAAVTADVVVAVIADAIRIFITCGPIG